MVVPERKSAKALFIPRAFRPLDQLRSAFSCPHSTSRRDASFVVVHLWVVSVSPFSNRLEQIQNRVADRVRQGIFHSRHLAGEVSASDESVFCHLPKMLIEHLLRDWRKPSFKFAGMYGATLEMPEDRHSPLPSNQGDRELCGQLLADRERVRLPSSLIDREDGCSLSAREETLRRITVIFPKKIFACS